MMQWVIFYADGSYFSSEDGSPGDAPSSYVEVVMQRNDQGGKDIIDGAGTDYEFYCWHGKQWVIHNLSGLNQYLAMPNSPKIYLRGFHLPDEQFWRIHNLALDHPDWRHLPTRLRRTSEWPI